MQNIVFYLLLSTLYMRTVTVCDTTFIVSTFGDSIVMGFRSKSEGSVEEKYAIETHLQDNKNATRLRDSEGKRIGRHIGLS